MYPYSDSNENKSIHTASDNSNETTHAQEYTENIDFEKENKIEMAPEFSDNLKQSAQERPDQRILDLVVYHIQLEMSYREHYKALIGVVAEIHKKLMREIYLDEIKAIQYLTDIYYKATGALPPQSTVAVVMPGADIGKDIRDKILLCQTSMEQYRRLYNYFFDMDIRDMFFEIITDKVEHSTLLMLIYLEMDFRQKQ